MILFSIKDEKIVKENGEGVSRSFNVPTSTIAILASLIPIIEALSAILINWVVGVPKDFTSMELLEKNYKVQLLQRVLTNDDEEHRANSLKLLLAAELLEDPKNKVSDIAENPTNVPKWDKHPIEGINGTLVTNTSRNISSQEDTLANGKPRPQH